MDQTGSKEQSGLIMTLNQLKPGQSATVVRVGGEGALHRHLLDMGLTPGVSVLEQKTAPMGDPIEIHLRGYSLTLRLDDAKTIEITDVEGAAQ